MEDIAPNIEMKLSNIFIPSSSKRRELMKAKKGRFVHYTSAENAISIIRSREIWMRNTRCMNDYMEVSHGYELLRKFLADKVHGESFIKALEPCGKDIASKAIKLFDQWWQNITFHNTFICSISEHDPMEDKHGRLSMWRAYGQQSTKAAIVIHSPFESDIPNVLNLLLIPTAYYDQDQLNNELEVIINNIKENIDFLMSLDSQIILNIIFVMLLTTTVSLKHEGFKEEKEWRVIYFPELYPSTLMSRTIEIINGLPQIIYKIPLKDNPAEKLAGLSIPYLVERIIIGPTQFPSPLSDAFKLALLDAGVENPNSRIVVSGIPLRT